MHTWPSDGERLGLRLGRGKTMMSSAIFARIAFYPSLLWGIATESSTKRWYDRIDTHLILGALPFKSQTKEVCTRTYNLCIVFFCLVLLELGGGRGGGGGRAQGKNRTRYEQEIPVGFESIQCTPLPN